MPLPWFILIDSYLCLLNIHVKSLPIILYCQHMKLSSARGGNSYSSLLEYVFVPLDQIDAFILVKVFTVRGALDVESVQEFATALQRGARVDKLSTPTKHNLHLNQQQQKHNFS